MSNSQTSRIIVKNLPRRIDERRLRTHFAAKGTITDVKMMHTPSGVFRRFAFIGYSSPQEASAAIEFYDDTFIDTSRIEVAVSKSVGDPDLPRPWSRHSAGSSLNRETQKQMQAEKEARKQEKTAKIRAEIDRKKAYLKSIYGDDGNEELGKFLQASKSKSQTRTWENDDGELVASSVKPQAKRVKVVPVANKKPGGGGLVVTKTHVTFSDSEYGAVDGRSESSDDDLYDDFVPNMDENELSDNEDCNEIDCGSEIPAASSRDSRALKPDLINETARLFVRNLAYSCSEDDLRGLFEPFGKLEEVHVSLSRETKRPKGYAYIKFVSAESALQAYQKLDGAIFQGRLLHILPAAPKLQSVSVEASKSSYKDQKLAKQKAEAGKDFNWNSLFVRSDTVLSSIATQLGISKAEIMNPSSGNLAIRLATAETHLIADTKRYLVEEGVDLGVFEAAGSREKSKTVIIVKNFPFKTERNELAKAFGKFGPLGRVIYPPSKTIAIIEFLEANDAKTAFRALAYSKFHNSPLFLEFSPEGILKGSAVATEVEKPVVIADSLIDRESVDSSASNDTLFVKNINFDTTEDTLREMFSVVGPLRAATIPRKRDSRRPDAGLLSMGFAFVQYGKTEHASLALDRLQGTLIDGHAVVLKRSCNTPGVDSVDTRKKRKTASVATNTDPDNATLMVRNIPFEASEREVRDLFRNFAQVKRVRVPRKFDGGHRGFGFIDFVNTQEARSALATLQHTHLYGRHLVIEWAETRHDLESLRDKAAHNILSVNPIVGNNTRLQ